MFRETWYKKRQERFEAREGAGSAGAGFGAGGSGLWGKEHAGPLESENSLQPTASKERRSSVLHKDMYFANSLAELGN